MTITLVLTDAAGDQGFATRDVVLGTGENAPPDVALDAAETWVEAGRPVDLAARASDADGDPLAYLWTYRVLDGGVASDGHGHDHGEKPADATAGEFVLASTSDTASVSFDAPGQYAVRVRVSDPKGGEATAETIIDVSRRIPPPTQEATFAGTLAAGTGGEASVAEAAWDTGAPDTFVDAARHAFSLHYPATTLVLLSWNDTGGQGVSDLDVEVRDAAGEFVAEAATRGGAATETLTLELGPGEYTFVVRDVAGAQVDYALLVRATLHLTPERVAAVEG